MENEVKENVIETAETEIAERERKQFVKMTQTPITRLVILLGIPTMLSMMVTSLYNLADTYFVSMLHDTGATAAVSNLLALMSVIQAVGFTFGMGSGALVSALLGKRNREEADKVASSAFFVSLISGVVIMIVGLLFLEPLMKLLGSSALTGEEVVETVGKSTLDYSKEYGFFVLLSAPIMCMSFVMNNVLRAEGKAVLSMIGLVVGAVINVALDPLLIFVADMGLVGAAVATLTSQIISFFVLLSMFLFRRTVIRLRIKAISWKFETYWKIIATGFPSFCRQILASLCTVFLSHAARDYAQSDAQSALGIVQKMFMLAFSISLGIGQGYQPVLGYNYSAKKFDRVRKAYLFTLAFSTGLMIVFALICGIFAPWIMKMFNQEETAAKIGTITLRLQSIAMPLLPLNFMAGLSYQVVGNKGLASLLSISRQGLFYIPAVLILPRVWEYGVHSCQAISDVFAFFFALPFTFIFFKGLKKAQAEADRRKAEGLEEEVEIYQQSFTEE